mmetsp:Transcript_4114/g.11677  ORF Transcript_4114/g.11677 Transcript_4114/m.11677 type:complete len:127 (-) Transcript_4114:1500-1880(-)
MLVPLLNKFHGLFVADALPSDQLFAFRLALDAVADSSHHHHKAKEASRSHLMTVQYARKSNAQEYPRRHYDGENNSSKVLDGVKDEQLTNCGTDRKEEEVEMNLGVLNDETERRAKFLRMDQCDEG